MDTTQHKKLPFHVRKRISEIYFVKGESHPPKRYASILKYQKEGVISHEMFQKSSQEKKRLKELKSQVNNEAFLKKMLNGKK